MCFLLLQFLLQHVQACFYKYIFTNILKQYAVRRNRKSKPSSFRSLSECMYHQNYHQVGPLLTNSFLGLLGFWCRRPSPLFHFIHTALYAIKMRYRKLILCRNIYRKGCVLFSGSVSYSSCILCSPSGTDSQSILTLECNFNFGLQMVQLLRVLLVKSQIKLSVQK